MTKKVLFIAAAAALAFSWAAPPALASVQSAQPVQSAQSLDPDDPLPSDPAVVEGALDNGLRYFVRENGQPENRALLRLVVNVGSILEDEDQLGLAHFVEHMAFNGTRNFEKQALVDYMESIGMEFGPHVNAYTSFDETVYMLQVPMDDPEALGTALQILEDWASALLFDPEEVDKERGVVIEEWRGRRGASARMQDQQLPVLFEGSLYAERLPIGKPEVLETAPVDALRRYYQDWYRPSLMAVVAVGDFDGARVEAMIKEQFAGLQDPSDPRPRTTAEVPIDHPPRMVIATDPEAPQSQVSVLYKQSPRGYRTVGDFRRSLVRSLYSGMLVSRFNELRQQADPPFLFAFAGRGSFVRGVDVSQLVAYVPEGGVERGLDALLTEAERVARHGFTESELERLKTNMLRSYEQRYAERDNQESRSLAGAYVNAFLEGRAYTTPEVRKTLADQLMPGITLDEVNALASERLSEEGRVVLVDAPDKEGLETPTEADLGEVFAAVEAKQIDPYEDAALDAPLVPELPVGSSVASVEAVDEVGITVWTLENGVRVVLKPTDFKDDEIRFSATSPGGSSLVTDEMYERIGYASSIVSAGGVGEFDQIALTKKLAGKAATVRPTIGSLTEGITGSASPKDLETAFQLMYLYFVAPRRDENAFEAFKARQIGFFANAAASPNSIFTDTVVLTMAQHHPRVPSLPSEEDFAKIDLDAVFSYYQDRFADASDFTFYFVGAFDVEEIRPLVERYLGALPNVGRVETWRDVGIDPPAGVIEKVVRKGIEPQSRTRIIYAGEADHTPEENMAISALADVLDIRLRELLREDLGGTYGVGVSGSISYRPDHEYRLSISFGSAPERAEELASVAFEEIERLKAEGPSQETVDKVRETQRRGKETNLRENSYWLSRMRTLENLGLDLKLVPSYDLIEGWTAQQVQEAAVRYLRTDQYAKFVLLPEGVVP